MKKNLLITISILGVLLPVIVLSNMMDSGNYGGMGNRMAEMLGGFWPWIGGGMIFGLILWVLIIIGIIYLIRWIIRETSGGKESKKSEAIEILKERYAKGEINKQEFEEKLKDLTK